MDPMQQQIPHRSPHQRQAIRAGGPHQLGPELRRQAWQLER